MLSWHGMVRVNMHTIAKHLVVVFLAALCIENAKLEMNGALIRFGECVNSTQKVHCHILTNVIQVKKTKHP